MTRSDEVESGTSGAVRIYYEPVADRARSEDRHLYVEDDSVAQDSALAAAGLQTATGTYVSASRPRISRTQSPGKDDSEQDVPEETGMEVEMDLEVEDEREVNSGIDEEDDNVGGDNAATTDPTPPTTQVSTQPPLTVPAQVATQTQTVAPAPAPALAAPASAPPAGQQLFTQEEVQQWEDRYDFRHLGRGRWALGLPAGGSSSRTAVRGPGAEAWRNANLKKRR